MDEKMRIYVGGLGASVQEDDLRKTFTSPHLGTVESVEIIRSKSRSFAYLDFVPSSDKGLAKLFSAYNGCMWKGGKLKLEKAREHYLLRLGREWTEDAEPAEKVAIQNVDTDDQKHTFPKSKEDIAKMQLNIFFPRLRKIKAVPLKGTGKHKYSFQRVEVPPLPIHFCDCEEHCGPPEPAKRNGTNDPEIETNDPEIETCGVNEEELNMMKSVLDKLFEKETYPETFFSNDAERAEEIKKPVTEFDQLEVSENDEDCGSDDDDLVINVVTRPSNRIALSQDRGQKKTAGNQNTFLGEPEVSGSRVTKEVHGSQKKLLPDKKRKAPLRENEPDKKSKLPRDENGRKENDRIDSEPPKTKEHGPHNKLVSKRKAKKKGGPHENMNDSTGQAQLGHDAACSHKSEREDLVSEKESTAFHIADILGDRNLERETKAQSENLASPVTLEKDNQDHQLLEDKELEKVPHVDSTEPSASDGKPARGASWLQKASWLQLVGDTNKSSFSLAQLLPGVNLEKQEVGQSSGHGSSNVEVANQHRSALNDENSPSVNSKDTSNVGASVQKQDHTGLDAERSNSDAKPRIEQEASAFSPGSSGVPSNKAPSLGEIIVSETCPFMKSAASMREWTKTKAALAASLKKKAKGKEPVQN